MPLAVGLLGQDEVVELDLTENSMSPADIHERIAAETPAGIEILKVEAVPVVRSSARVREVEFILRIPEELHEAVQCAIRELMAKESHLVSRPDKKRTVDIRPHIRELRLEAGCLYWRVAVTPQWTVRPREVLMALGIAGLESEGAVITRTAVELQT
jgi:radical SAM-linked protein